MEANVLIRKKGMKKLLYKNITGLVIEWKNEDNTVSRIKGNQEYE